MNTREISDRNDAIIRNYIEAFSIDQKPIEVSFRELLPEIKDIDRYTHLIHTYPAKLLVHIPYFFLNNSILSNEGDTVLDPFNGSGTVLLESILSNRNAIGADNNPLARLISEVKVTKLNTKELSIKVKKLVSAAKKYKSATTPDVVNCDFWFPKKAKDELAKLLKAINKIKDERVRKFMLVSFSNCVKKVSYADQRVSVPVRLNPERYENGTEEKKKINARLKHLERINVFDKFLSITLENIERFRELENVPGLKKTAKIISTDARNLSHSTNKSLVKNNSIQLVITSPPYAGAQKYIRASSLNLGWTELAKVGELIHLDRKSIGRESFKKSEIKIIETGIQSADELIKTIYKLNPERANIVCQYLLEMKCALNEIVRVLKRNGYLVLVLGNNKVCNKEFNTQEYLTDYLASQGLKLQFKLIDDIRSYGLMTKRNKTADIISREWILVFKK